MSTDNGTTDPDQVSIADEPEQLTVDEKRALARHGQAPIDHALNSRPFGSLPKSYPHRLRIVEQLKQPTPLFMSASISKMDGYEAHADFVSEALPALDALHDVLVSAIAVREKSQRNPELESEASQVMAVADWVDKLMTPASTKVDAAVSVISARLKAAEAEMRTGIDSNSSYLSPLAGQVRDYCRALPNVGERVKFVSELIAANDTESLAAILRPNKPFLSGLTQRECEMLIQQYNRARKPALPERIEVMSKVLDHLNRAGAQFVLKLENAMGCGWESIAKLRAAKAAAKFG